MAKDIQKRINNLPIKPSELQKWIIIERSKLAARRRALQNISDIQTGADAYRGFLKDTQDSAEELLYAEARLGEMIPPQTQKFHSSGKGKMKRGVLPEGISYKQSHYAQTLNKNINSIAEVVAEAKEKDEIPTRSQVLRHIKRQRPETKPPPLPKGKYNVIYADPPWKYSDELIENYGSATHHYPVMSIEQLCEMEVNKICAENAALFLWVTSPMLDKCFSVISAWDFKYKTSFVWDKVKHNYGHYNSVRHEFLLLCTRGSFTPENKKLFDSVQSIERTEKHSEKPKKFREIIETLYPSAHKLELFARKKHKSWKGYGNEL